MGSFARSCSPGRVPDVLGCGGNGSLLLVATVIRSPREADGPLTDRQKARRNNNSVSVRSGSGTGAAQCVWNTQPAREIVELPI